MSWIYVCVCVCLGSTDVSPANPPATAQSDPGSKQSRVGAADKSWAVSGQYKGSGTSRAFFLFTHTNAKLTTFGEMFFHYYYARCLLHYIIY